eukprot:5315738-Alexandrium_andersonii.AAC.1
MPHFRMDDAVLPANPQEIASGRTKPREGLQETRRYSGKPRPSQEDRKSTTKNNSNETTMILE